MKKWKKIEGIKPDHLVSKTGLVKYANSVFNLKQFKSNTGYKFVRINNKSFFVHRLVAESFINNPEKKEQVNHIDGNKTNNHVNNLEWCTRLENMHHAIKNGLYKGSKCITHDIVKSVKDDYSTGKYSYKDLVKKYGISSGSISNIINDKIQRV